MKNSSFNIKFWKPNWIAQNFKSSCLKCYLSTYKALPTPVRESIWYLFNCFPVPGALDKLYHLILIIAPGGRNYYPCFIEEETERRKRGEIICKTIKFKARTWTWIWHQRLSTFPLYCLQCRRKKCVCEKWKWLWSSRRIVLPSSSMKSAGPCYVKYQHKFEPAFIEWFHSYRLLGYR